VKIGVLTFANGNGKNEELRIIFFKMNGIEMEHVLRGVTDY